MNFFKKSFSSFTASQPRSLLGRLIKLSLLLAIPGYFFLKRYQYYIENDPKYLRENFTDKHFNNEDLYQQAIKNKRSLDFYKLTEFLMGHNLIPGCGITEQTKERLKCEFLKKEYSYPIGLNAGIDTVGEWTLNLSKLGFEFVMIGPFSDKTENNFTEQNKGDNKPITTLSIDYAMSLFNQNIDLIRSANLKTLATEIFVSKASHTIAPYLTEKKLNHMLDSALSFADYVCLDLSSLIDSLALKGKSPAKMESFLEKIGSTLYKSIGLRACYEYEFANGFSFSEKSVSKKISPISPVFNKGKSAILLRIRDDFTDEFLEQMLLTVSKSKIVDAIIVDANLKENEIKETEVKNNTDGLSPRENMNQEESVPNQRLRIIRKILGNEFPIISCGGVKTGQDVFLRLKSGADFVLVDTVFRERGPYCLEKIAKELEKEMESNNIRNIKNIRALNNKI